jgi:hypothetical protein
MHKQDVKTAQLERLASLARAVQLEAERVRPEKAADWAEWNEDVQALLKSVWRQSARPYAGPVMGEVAEIMATQLLALLMGREAASDQEPPPAEPMPVRSPRTTTVYVDGEEIEVRSAAHQEILRLMGQEGLSRSWRIYDHLIWAGLAKNERSAQNMLGRLTDKGLVAEYEEAGEVVRWTYTNAGARRLPVLTEAGRDWVRAAYGGEPVASELVWAVERHSSVAHGVAILEARDHLEATGHRVIDAPEPMLACAEERWGQRVEPDLVIESTDGTHWPVEVQREVSQRVLEKLNKVLALGNGQLVVIVFNRQSRERLEALLKEEAARRKLRPGTILLTSLEAMEAEAGWDWVPIRTTHW